MYTNSEEPKLLICSECESEIEIKVLYSEHKITVCPFCAEPIECESGQDDD